MACWYLETCFCYCFCLYKSGRLGRNNMTHSMHAFMHAQSPRVSRPLLVRWRTHWRRRCLVRCALVVQAQGEALRLALVWAGARHGPPFAWLLPVCSLSQAVAL